MGYLVIMGIAPLPYPKGFGRLMESLTGGNTDNAKPLPY